MTRTPYAALAVMLAAFLVAAGWGMRADLPYSSYSTEVEQVFFALKFGSGDLNPHLFLHPPFFAYVLCVVYGTTYVAGRASGYFSAVADFERLWFTDPTIFYLIARFFVLGLAAAGCLVFYWTALRLYRRRDVALLATAFLCSAYLFVITAHYASTDIPMFFLSMLSMWMIARVLEDGETRHYVGAGLLIGLATATKYNAAWLGTCLVAAHAIRGVLRREGLGPMIFSPRLALGCTLVGVGFLIGCPAWLDYPAFIRDYALLHKMTVTDPTIWHFDSFRAKGSGPYYLFSHVFPFLTGSPLTWLSALGLLYSAVRRTPADLLLAFFCVSYCWYVGRWGVIKARYFIAVLPFLLLLGARALAEAADWVRGRRLRAGLLALVFCALIAPSWVRIIQFDRRIARRWIVLEAKDWMEAHVAPGTAVAVMDSIILNPNLASINRRLTEIRAKGIGQGVQLQRMARHAPSMAVTFDVHELPYPWRDDFEPEKFDFDRLARAGVRYFVVTQEVDDYLVDPLRYAAQVRWFEEISRRCRRVASFRQRSAEVELDGAAEEYIEIYELPVAGAN